MSLTQVAATESGVPREPNDKRVRRRKPLPGRLRRLSQELAQAEEDARLEEKENADDHERVRAIFQHMLRRSVVEILELVTDAVRE
jgi:hypothetical protein